MVVYFSYVASFDSFLLGPSRGNTASGGPSLLQHFHTTVQTDNQGKRTEKRTIFREVLKLGKVFGSGTEIKKSQTLVADSQCLLLIWSSGHWIAPNMPYKDKRLFTTLFSGCMHLSTKTHVQIPQNNRNMFRQPDRSSCYLKAKPSFICINLLLKWMLLRGGADMSVRKRKACLINTWSVQTCI